MSSTIVLATSAPQERKEYRRDFLTCIAAPDGHRVSFLFRGRWWQPSLLTPDTNLVGRDALVVFCERSEGSAEFDFLPYRHAIIESVEPKETIRDGTWSPETGITVTFSLGSLVYANDQELQHLRRDWHKWLAASDARPKPDGSEGSYFVFEHTAFPDRAPVDDRSSWATLSAELAECPSLEGAYFFRVEKFVEQGRTEEEIRPSRQKDLQVVVYELDTNRQYSLTLDTYSKSGEKPIDDILEARTNSDKLAIQWAEAPSAGRSTRWVVLLDTRAVSWPQIATLLMRGKQGHDHDIARVDLALRIAPRARDIALLMVVLALGVLLTGVSKDDFALPVWAAYLMKFTGAAIVAAAGYVALRRAPGIVK